MAELREETRANTQYILSKGYNVAEMWECEWRQIKKNQPRITAFYRHRSLQNPGYSEDYERGTSIERGAT